MVYGPSWNRSLRWNNQKFLPLERREAACGVTQLLFALPCYVQYRVVNWWSKDSLAYNLFTYA